MINQVTYLREINWDRHTATLRTARIDKKCCVCKQLIPAGAKFYSVTLWNAGLAGKKFPSYVHCEHLEEYRRRHS